jgi:acyl-CoA hydrolase
MDSLSFRGPIGLGEVAVIRAQVNWAGRTSIEVGCRVEAEDPKIGERRHTSTAYLTFVALDNDRHPVAVPKLMPEDDNQQRRFDEAIRRRTLRLQEREKQGRNS